MEAEEIRDASSLLYDEQVNASGTYDERSLHIRLAQAQFTAELAAQMAEQTDIARQMLELHKENYALNKEYLAALKRES